MVPIRVAPGKVKPVPPAAHRRWVITALRTLTGVVFVYAGQAKIQDPASFADSIDSFRLVPTAFDNLIALGLPPFEMLVGFFLIVGWRVRTMAFCALLASGVFFLALGSAWVRGIPVDCGCFGTSLPVAARGSHMWISLGRDLLLAMVTAVVYVDARRQEETHNIRVGDTGD